MHTVVDSQPPVTERKHAEQRAELRDRLCWEGETALASVMNKCAEPFRLACSKCSTVREVEKGCKKRWCPVCAPKLAAHRVNRWEWEGNQMQWPLAVTLTVTNRPDAAGCIRELRRAITTFKRHRIITGTVAGGIIGVEVTNTGHGWHPHAHLLIDCRWLALTTPAPRRSSSSEETRALCVRAQRELSRAWAAHLGQAEAVVWVERAWGKAIMETVKYMVKPTDLLSCKARIGPLLREMHRQKAITAFGSCYGHGAKYEAALKAIKPPCTCEKCGAEGTMMPDALMGRYIERERAERAANVRMVIKGAHRESSWYGDGIPY